MVQWLRLQASNGGGVGSIPSLGTKISPAAPVAKKVSCEFHLIFKK